MSRFLSGPSAEPRQQSQLGSPQGVVALLGLDGQVLVHPEAVDCEASAEPWAGRGRGPAAVHAIALWLRRALADSARAWALAAGVPPDLYNRPVVAVLAGGGEERPSVIELGHHLRCGHDRQARQVTDLESTHADAGEEAGVEEGAGGSVG